MKVGLAELPASLIPVAFFTRWMAAPRGQEAGTTTHIGLIEFDFSILVLALLLAKGFMCFAADEAAVDVAEMGRLLHAGNVLTLSPRH
jgi:hypothetical protein